VEKSRENGGKGWKNDVTGVEERLEKLKTGEGKEVRKLGRGTGKWNAAMRLIASVQSSHSLTSLPSHHVQQGSK